MANNCKAVFVNNTPLVCTVTDNGDGTYTFNNHIDPPVTWSTGGADTDTSIVFNQVLPNGDWEFNVVDVLTNTVLTTFTVPAPTISIIDNGDNTFTYIDVAGNPTVIAYEHTLVDNNDGTFTFTQPDGTPTTIDVCKLQQDSGCAATMVDNGDGTYTYTDINGVSTTFTGGVANVLTTITNTVIGHKIADYTDENGGITPIYETISTLVNNGDGTATFTNEDGAVITFPIGGVSIVDNTDGTYLVTLADGSTITIGDTSISTLVDNGDNTYTYTDETGVATIFDVTGVLTTITNTIVGNKIADYTDEAGGVTPINESITSFASITDGYQFTSEDGTVYPFTFTFDNTTPSAPQLLVNYGATIVATIPLNSYDVNIATTGGFALNPLTDVITITETDGETHTIDLSYLRSTLTSTDGSVQSIISINPDGSTNYDLGVKSHSNETQAIPYTGVELPTTPGINIGDTNSTQFSDGTVVNYTWDGTAWVVDFVESCSEERICLNTATPAFITTIVTGQTNVGLYFNYDGNPFDITSFKINGNELLISTINVYDAGSNYIYTNQLVPLFNSWMTTNGYTGTIDDDIDGNGGVNFSSLSGGVLTFEIVTDEGGVINTYIGTSNLITVPSPLDPNNPTTAEVETWKNANLTLQQQTNGTILTYFVPGDGGSCDVPDYTWTLNKGSELITLDNKLVKNSNILYIDNVRGSDITGRRHYSDFPFKTFIQAILNYQENDWIKYWNTDEIITTTIDYTANPTTNIDFGSGTIYLNSFLFTNGLALNNSKLINILSTGKIIASSSGLLSNFGDNSNVLIDINEYSTPRTISSSKGNYIFKANTIRKTSANRMFWFSGSNKSISIQVENLFLNHTLPINSYDAGCFNFEAALGNTLNSNIDIDVTNIVQNSYVGTISDIGCGSGNSIYDSNFNLKIDNLYQYSTYTSYLAFPINNPRSSNIELFRSSYSSPIFNNINYNILIDNAISDLSLDAEFGANATINGCNVNVKSNNHLCKKLQSIIYNGSHTINNTIIKYEGNYINVSDKEIIRLHGITLNNESKIIFDGVFKNNYGVILSGVSIDATSKIVFKGRYELGNGNFDISGVTGAGADNIYFEDCTIITNNTECIVSGTPKNIKILDVRSNKPTNVNVTETIQSITINTNIN
jgi:hypothetical protein